MSRPLRAGTRWRPRTATAWRRSNWALLYLRRQGVPKNSKRAAELFKQSADKGYPPAQYNLALLHVEGADASPSLAEAAR